MTDPLNTLPISAEWVKRGDELTKQAAKELGCMVILLAVQENGKLALNIEGIPDSGPIHEAAQNVPHMLVTLAGALVVQDALDKGKTRQ